MNSYVGFVVEYVSRAIRPPLHTAFVTHRALIPCKQLVAPKPSLVVTYEVDSLHCCLNFTTLPCARRPGLEGVER